MNEEIRRRERVIRIFPNRASAFRMIGAVLMELDEKWSTTRSYLDMTLYTEWKAIQEKNGNQTANQLMWTSRRLQNWKLPFYQSN